MIGRLIGWALVGIASLAASGDALVFLGTGDFQGLAAREILLLLLGIDPAVPAGSQGVVAGTVDWLLALPFWLPLIPSGLMLVLACRRRRKRLFAGAGRLST